MKFINYKYICLSFYNIFLARLAILLYILLLFPFVLLILTYSLALLYAAIIPNLLIEQVFFLQIGNDFFVPKKHFLPQFLSITVF